MNAMQQAKALEKEIVAEFGQDWVENLNQRVGVAFDYTLPDGSKFELKCDIASATTGNFFLETHQQFQGGPWIPSGISLALEQADMLLLANAEEAFSIETTDLDTWLKHNGPRFRTTTTRAAANGNRDGNAARGILVPCRELRKLATARFVRMAPGVFIEAEKN